MLLLRVSLVEHTPCTIRDLTWNSVRAYSDIVVTYTARAKQYALVVSFVAVVIVIASTVFFKAFARTVLNSI